MKITHFISFSGKQIEATSANYAKDAKMYLATVNRLIAFALDAKNDHDREAYAQSAGMYAKVAAHSGRMALELRQQNHNANRRARHQAYLDCGLKRVKGALGGTYYE